MKIISLINQKGGVGKTTISVNLAVYLSRLNNKVLLIDMDPQGDSTDNSGIDYELKSSTKEFLLDSEKPIIKTKYYDLIPSDISLADFEVLASTKIAREFILKEKLEQIDDYDYVIIDCPPSLGFLTINALVASNIVISPILLERFSLKGIKSLYSTLEEIKKINKEVIFKILINKLNKNYKHNIENLSVIEESIQNFKLKTHIRQDVKISNSQDEMSNIFDFSKNSKSAEDFQKLAEEVVNIG